MHQSDTPSGVHCDACHVVKGFANRGKVRAFFLALFQKNFIFNISFT